ICTSNSVSSGDHHTFSPNDGANCVVSAISSLVLFLKMFNGEPVKGKIQMPGSLWFFVRNAMLFWLVESPNDLTSVFVSGSSRGLCRTNTAVMSVTSSGKTSTSFSHDSNPSLSNLIVY